MTYPQSTIDKVCELLAQGLAILDIEEMEGMPDRCTIARWESAGDENAASITRARIAGIDARVEAAVRRAQSAPDAALGRLAFDADRWYASKVNPKRYGDKLGLGHADGMEPVKVQYAEWPIPAHRLEQPK